MEEGEKQVLFGPKTGKHLLKLYPDLEKEPAFKKLSNEELLFAWYMGCKSSPIDPEWPEQTRLKTAASYSIKDEAMRANFAAGKVPDRVREAYRKFGEYEPEARMVAKRMVQNMFTNLEKLVNVDPNDFVITTQEGGEDGVPLTVTKEIDWTGRKQYIESCKTTATLLPTLIDQMEKGFGISDEKKGGKTTGNKAIDKFHQQNRENG